MRVLQHYILWNLGLAAAGTQTSAAERKCLARHASGRRLLVEIGVWHGVTTSLLRSVMSPEGILIAVDPFPVGRLGFSIQMRIAHFEVGRVSNGTVCWDRTTGVEAARSHFVKRLGLVDFVFIDGDHSFDGLRGDWEAWNSLVHADGIVALHDSRVHGAQTADSTGSVRFTEEVIRKDPRFECIEEIDSLTVFRRLVN